MLNKQRFGCYLGPVDQPVIEGSPLWHTVLPSQRDPAVGSGAGDAVITYGEYYEAAAGFLNSQAEAMSEAASVKLKRQVGPEDLEGLNIFLEKHGAFYHPSRVAATIMGQTLNFVLNVAISHAGRTYLDQEVACLGRLNHQRPYGFLPRVYARGERAIDENRSVKLFLGEWFDGYAEFHVNAAPSCPSSGIRVWDPMRQNQYLSYDQAVAVYAAAMEILTAYYDVETCERIFSWHHAAGDFIVKLDRNAPQVKLVTVRRYNRMIEGGERDAGASVQALILFLLSTSLNMRIDRVAGVGEMTWLGEYAVEGVPKGFFNGLERQARLGFLPEGFGSSFKAYLRDIPPAEIEGLFAAIADRLPAHAPEGPLVKANLETHVDVFLNHLRSV